MTYIPIRGYDGSLKVGSNAAVAVLSWDADINLDITVDGPFLNDSGKKYKVIGGVDAKGTAKCKVPDAKDSVLTTLAACVTGGSGGNLVLTQGTTSGGYSGGYVLTLNGALITSFKPGQDSKNGATVDIAFEANGSISLA